MIDVFKGNRRTEHRWYTLKPGILLSLEADREGRLSFVGEVTDRRTATRPILDRTRRGEPTGASVVAIRPPLDALPLEVELPGVGGMLEYAREGKYLIGAGPADLVRVVDRASPDVNKSLRLEGGDITCLATDGDRTVATGGSDFRTRLWSAEALMYPGRKPSPIATLENLSGEVRVVALSREGELVATGHEDGTVKLWNQKGQLLGDVGQRRLQPVTRLRFDPAGRLLAVGCWRGSGVEVWDLGNGDLSRLMRKGEFSEAPQQVSCLAFSRDGMTLAAGGENGRVTLWDRRYGNQARYMEMPMAVHALDFSPTDLLAIGLDDGRVVINGTRDGYDRARFQAHAKPVGCVAFAPDGRTLATCDWGQGTDVVRIWDTSELVDRTRSSQRRMGPDERTVGPDGRPIGPRKPARWSPSLIGEEAGPVSPGGHPRPSGKVSEEDALGPRE